ncbi:hypothetical protein Ancab_026927 [Ancistrocladus abbreviatus]
MAAEEGGGGGGGGSGSGDEAASSVSPTSRVKFCCSYGGKILPRPSDGFLKYVGGETRVVAVPRKITFSGLKKIVSNLFEGDFVIKYHIASEDLDALVSVKSDEDLRHMFEEYDRLESEGNSKLRTFLFPPKPTILDTGQNSFSALPHSLEQRFVDAVNGVVRITRTHSRLKSVSSSPPESTSSHSISPNDAAHSSSTNSEASVVNSIQTRLTRMHKVHSSPSICSLGSHQNNNTQPSNDHNRHYYYSHGHQHQHQHQQYHHAYQTPYRMQDQMHQPHSMVQPDFGKVATGHCHGRYNYSKHRAYPGSGGHNKWGHLADYAAASVAAVPAYVDGNLSRTDSFSR